MGYRMKVVSLETDREGHVFMVVHDGDYWYVSDGLKTSEPCMSEEELRSIWSRREAGEDDFDWFDEEELVVGTV